MPKIDDVFERTIRLDESVSRINEKVDQLIAAVSAAPAAAGHPPPPADSAKAGGEPLPNNLSQLAGFAIDKLGKFGTPILIIVIVIGTYLGIQEVLSTINQRDEIVRKTFTETVVATLKVGKSVVENTEKLIKLNAELGKTGEILLNLQRKAADEAAKAVTEKQNAERAVQKSEDLQKNLATKVKSPG